MNAGGVGGRVVGAYAHSTLSTILKVLTEADSDSDDSSVNPHGTPGEHTHLL